MIVIADKYQYGRFGKTIDKNVKRLVRPKMKVDESYVEDQNERLKNEGVFYVIDQEATEAWRYEHDEWKENKKRIQEAHRKMASANLAEIISQAASSSTLKTQKTSKVDKELEDARSKYEKVFGEKPHHKKLKESILEEIQNETK